MSLTINGSQDSLAISSSHDIEIRDGQVLIGVNLSEGRFLGRTYKIKELSKNQLTELKKVIQSRAESYHPFGFLACLFIAIIVGTLVTALGFPNNLSAQIASGCATGGAAAILLPIICYQVGGMQGEMRKEAILRNFMQSS